ncbi:DUF445 domain-containing protein [Clostridium sp.]|uniref:DUF445 domain-containing protein n=2 Tax=Clostridium TaxID=1485 RepID=UPI00258E44D7|nr:DUF445 domain-containing protein [Clostridium sp.]MDF2503640.1 putative rane protein [Clostridium sp.]
MDKKNKRRANLILIIVAIGFLISYAFKDAFVWDLISRCCMAALIGGLADWFGITAIFKKPFNINWPKFLFRTDIINKNRDRIVDTIAETIENDLLNKDKLKNKLNSYNIAIIIAKFIKSRKGDEALIKALDEVFVPEHEASKTITDFAYKSLSNVALKIKISEILYNLCLWSSRKGYIDILIDKIIDFSINIVKKENVTIFIEKLYADALKNYEKENINRKITNKLVLGYILDMSPSSAAYSIQKKSIEILKNMKNQDNKNRILLKEKVEDYILRLHNDIVLINKIENYKVKFFTENSFLNQSLERFLQDYFTENFYNNKNYIKNFKAKKRKIVLNFIRDRDKMNSIDKSIKDTTFKLIDDKYDYIGKWIRENLNKYSNKEIVDTMEQKLSEDLQIIRINGSIVGGLVGAVIYLLTFWIK